MSSTPPRPSTSEEIRNRRPPPLQRRQGRRARDVSPDHDHANGLEAPPYVRRLPNNRDRTPMRQRPPSQGQRPPNSRRRAVFNDRPNQQQNNRIRRPIRRRIDFSQPPRRDIVPNDPPDGGPQYDPPTRRQPSSPEQPVLKF